MEDTNKNKSINNDIDNNSNTVLNIRLKESIISGHNYNYNSIIHGYISNESFTPDIKILSDKWYDIRKEIINICICREKYRLIYWIFENDNIAEFIREFITIMINVQDKHMYILYHITRKFIDKGYEERLKILNESIYNYFMENMNKDIINIMLNKTNICKNEEECDDGINQTPIIYDTWKEALDEENILYKMNNGYIFIIDELMQYWDLNLCAYNYLLKPKFPRNFYTRELINPLDIYLVSYFCLLYDKIIPKNMNLFIKNPKKMIEGYKQNLDQITDEQRNVYMRRLLKEMNLKFINYEYSSAYKGHWEYDITKQEDYAIQDYMNSKLSISILYICMLKLKN